MCQAVNGLLKTQVKNKNEEKNCEKNNVSSADFITYTTLVFQKGSKFSRDISVNQTKAF